MRTLSRKKRRRLERKQRRRVARALRLGAVETYQDRDGALKSLGYRSYGFYVTTTRWFKIRMECYRDQGRRCLLCARRADVVHHIDYDPLTMVTYVPGSLAPLCDPCHGRVEFDDQGRKRTLRRARAEYYRLLALREYHQDALF